MALEVEAHGLLMEKMEVNHVVIQLIIHKGAKGGLIILLVGLKLFLVAVIGL
jgi:hypothetical protein